MVAMPYILVNIVASLLSVLLFCITSALLLAKYPGASLYLPARLRKHKKLVFVAHALVLLALSVAAVSLIARRGDVYIPALHIFEGFCWIGIANTAVLTYQFLDRRYFRNTSRVKRRLAIALCAVVLTFVGIVAVSTVVVGLFTIR